MQRRKRFLFDADEVLVDFQTPALEMAHRLFGRTVRPEDFEVWDLFSLFSEGEKQALFAEIEKPGFCESLKPKPGACEAVEKLRSLVDVYVVTSPWSSPTWVFEREAALKRLFAFQKREVVHTSAKYLVQGDYFLDDNPEHITSWSEAHPNGVAMLWHIPNTRNLGLDQHRVHTWDEVIKRVRDTL